MIKPKKILQNITPYQTDKYKQQWRLKLDSNENIYGASANILSAIKNFNPEDISLYPTYGKLIDKLVSKYELSEENFLLTNGCDEALSIIINSYLEIEDEILSYRTTFSMPALYAQIAGAKAKYIDYDKKFVFDYKKFKTNITPNTKLAYIATPNNPTGEIVKPVDIKILLEECENTLFIIDCTYTNFSCSVVLQDYIDLVNDYDNIAVVKSFSKDFAIAGLRLGFVAAKKEIVEELKKTSSPYNVNILALNCGIAALNDDRNFEEIKEQNINAGKILKEGLIQKGFTPFPSEANFILCDFGSYSDFYYEKLKKIGIITRNYAKNSPISTCLRITIPKVGGVKYILELLNKKDVLVFDLDGVIFDVSHSYTEAIKTTFKHFSGQEITTQEIQEVKNMGNMSCNWDIVKYLLDKYGFNIDIKEIIHIFQDVFYNPKIKKDDYLIDKEELLIPKEIFEELSQKYDLAYFSSRLKEEANYSLKKYDIEKYFYYSITSDDIPKNMLKPHPRGILEILEHCPHTSIKYFGSAIEDIIAGNSANIDTIGVIAPNSNHNIMVNNFKHLGANYILDDIKNLTSFLGEIEKDYAKNY